MRILLVNPPPSVSDQARIRCVYKDDKHRGSTPPVGLAYMAAVLEAQGWRVSILDASALHMDMKRILTAILDEHAGVVGFTTYTNTIDTVMSLAREVKQGEPGAIVVLGGPYASRTAARLITEPCVDFVFVGEAEFPFLTFVSCLAGNRVKDIEKIPTLMTKEKGRRGANVTPTYLEDLDRLPVPAYHLLPMKVYHPSARKQLTHKPRLGVLMTTRGCPFTCGFCDSSMGHVMRSMSVEHVEKELDLQVETYHVNELYFLDDILTFDKASNYRRTIEICTMIKPRDLAWSCNTRLDHVNRMVLRAMQESGCQRIHVGIESLAPAVLRRTGKGIDSATIERGIALVKDQGMEVSGNLIYGLPGDSPATFFQTIERARKVGVDYINIYPYMAHPGATFTREGYRITMDEVDFANISLAYKQFYSWRRSARSVYKL